MVSLLLAIIYLAFISLGLPDSLLGSAWPSIYPQFNVPVSYAGIVSMIISVSTIFSSLQSDRLTRKLGAGKVTAISVAMTAAALFGFSASKSFTMLCVCAVPYGLGAGGVDAALNNYVALHYESRHMSWLHCMWGVGATVGPYIMGYCLSNAGGWSAGYRCIGFIQIFLTAVLVFSLPLWNKKSALSPKTSASENIGRALTFKQIVSISGAKEIMICFFCYCAFESTAILWISSYLNIHSGISADEAASLAGIFFIGITVGRAISGFVTMKFNDTQMIRFGQCLIAVGVAFMLLSAAKAASVIGIVLIGLGCAPIYPCIIHSIPAHFGADKSQAIIGFQMACAYIGSLLMPPLFGLIANHITVALLPAYLLVFLVLMIAMHELLIKKSPIIT